MKTVLGTCVIALVVSGIVRAARQEGMEPPNPGKEHTLLAQCEGTWDVALKMHMDPTKPPVEWKAVETVTIGCNGLWIISDVKGDFMGAPFHGHGVWGYDTQKKKFVGSWIDSLGTYLTIAEGTWDEKTHSFTYLFESPMAKMKELHTIKDKDNRSIAYFKVAKDLKETPLMTMEITRKK